MPQPASFHGFTPKPATSPMCTAGHIVWGSPIAASKCRVGSRLHLIDLAWRGKRYRHASSKAGTLGASLILLAVAICLPSTAIMMRVALIILFLFLIYEKLKGRPPSVAFQNAATILGIALIATVLLVVTWNDVVRLVTGGM